jgi:hypothetical protein
MRNEGVAEQKGAVQDPRRDPTWAVDEVGGCRATCPERRLPKESATGLWS